MKFFYNFIESLEIVIGIYSFVYITVYTILLYYALKEIRNFHNSKYFMKYNEFALLSDLPGISIIAPAFNEELTIVENVNSLLNLKYPKFEVVIINDGSSDSTLNLLIEKYELKKVPKFYVERLKTNTIRGFYKSSNSKFENLIVIDKLNGGCKADASNAGINVSKYEYVICTDVDCILRDDALFTMLKPFITSSKKVLAVGAGIKAVNDSIVKNGTLHNRKYPKTFLPSFQEIEYTRAFVFGRMALSKINSLILVSGGLGMFDKQCMIDAGGYYHTSLAEDLDLVIRMRKIAKEKGFDYEVVYIPETLCWTEVPPNKEIFIKQRVRWARGLIQTLVLHKNLFFNFKYDKTGLIAIPYFVLFEFLVPIIEILGILVILTKFVFYNANTNFLFLILITTYLYYILVNYITIYIDELGKVNYTEKKHITKKLSLVLLEPLMFHPLTLYSSIKGYLLYIFNVKQSWGNMTRKGFNLKEND